MITKSRFSADFQKILAFSVFQVRHSIEVGSVANYRRSWSPACRSTLYWRHFGNPCCHPQSEISCRCRLYGDVYEILADSSLIRIFFRPSHDLHNSVDTLFALSWIFLQCLTVQLIKYVHLIF
jgi:hypothetical protein